jgi:hypothetical protein
MQRSWPSVLRACYLTSSFFPSFPICLSISSATLPRLLAQDQSHKRPRPGNRGMASLGKPQAATYNFIEDVEDVSKYRAGGFHPISIGDTMKEGRYRVVHKLGFGGYSTIWLALDTMDRQYVAVKICSADSREGSLEGGVLQRLSHSTQNDAVHPGERLVQTLIDAFDIQGPNGHHKCLVMPPAMMSIRDAKEASYLRLFRPETARSIITQLVLAVDFVHAKGIVHAGKFLFIL